MPAEPTPSDGRGIPEGGIPQDVRDVDAPHPPYQEVTDVAYGENASRTFEVEQPDRHTIVLRGRCPRCHHIMDFMISDHVVRRQSWFRFLVPETAPTGISEEPMMCTCGIDHPHRPPESVGCGAYWNLEIKRS